MICESCGYRSGDSATKCLLCGRELPVRLSEEELDAELKRLSDRADVLMPSPVEKVLGIVFFALAPINFTASIFLGRWPANVYFALFAAITAAVAGVSARYPKAMWELSKMRFALYANADDATPNDVWGILRKASYWLFMLASFVVVAFSFLSIEIFRS